MTIRRLHPRTPQEVQHAAAQHMKQASDHHRAGRHLYADDEMNAALGLLDKLRISADQARDELAQAKLALGLANDEIDEMRAHVADLEKRAPLLEALPDAG